MGVVGISASFGPEGPLGVLGVLWGQCFGSGGVPVLNPRISGRLISQLPTGLITQGLWGLMPEKRDFARASILKGPATYEATIKSWLAFAFFL